MQALPLRSDLHLRRCAVRLRPRLRLPRSRELNGPRREKGEGRRSTPRAPLLRLCSMAGVELLLDQRFAALARHRFRPRVEGMEFDDQLRRYFGTGDLASIEPGALAAGLDRMKVDF